ncbi:MAG TPA: TolC family protein [Candidatus Kapabacteria bacterium]|nr:TolC family protein [Candidatus Kapabacteria bacterium]
MKQRLSLASILCGILVLLALPAMAQGPGVPKTLNIDQAVQYALDRNPTVALAQSGVQTSSARVNGAFGAFLPQISVYGGYSKDLSADEAVIVQGIVIPTTRPDHSFSAGATANLTLFDGFGRSASYRSARNEFESSVQSLEQSRQDIAYQTRAAFLNALRDEQLIDVRQSDLDLARERLQQERDRVSAGAGLATSVYQQESDVANSELALEQARTDLVVARNSLLLMLNFDPTATVQLSSEGLANSVDSNEIAESRRQFGTLNDMLERQAQHRRDILAAKLKVESAESQVSVARAGYYPSISTSLGWNWQKAGDFDPSATTTFALNLQYTPFDGFHTSEQVQIAEAQRQSAELELRKLQMETRSRLEQALARLDGAERQLHAAERAVTASRQSRFSADERFKAGAGSYTDYLLANSQYLTAQVNQVNAVFNYRLAIYEVKYQIGE